MRALPVMPRLNHYSMKPLRISSAILEDPVDKRQEDLCESSSRIARATVQGDQFLWGGGERLCQTGGGWSLLIRILVPSSPTTPSESLRNRTDQFPGIHPLSYQCNRLYTHPTVRYHFKITTSISSTYLQLPQTTLAIPLQPQHSPLYQCHSQDTTNRIPIWTQP